VLELDEAAWDRVIRINLTGAFLMVKAAIPAMIARGGGSVVLIASQLGRVGAAGRPAYCATKGALIQLAKVLAADHAAQGIRANDFPKPYNAALLRIGGRSLPEAARSLTARTIRNDDPSGLPARLQQMDDAGVQMQILSPAASPPYAEKEADAVATARLINDAYTELARRHPGRFNAVVSLPLPHIDASLREMERGLAQLGMRGVSLTC